jgi:hypothetical protein
MSRTQGKLRHTQSLAIGTECCSALPTAPWHMICSSRERYNLSSTHDSGGVRAWLRPARPRPRFFATREMMQHLCRYRRRDNHVHRRGLLPPYLLIKGAGSLFAAVVNCRIVATFITSVIAKRHVDHYSLRFVLFLFSLASQKFSELSLISFRLLFCSVHSFTWHPLPNSSVRTTKVFIGSSKWTPYKATSNDA